jgi:2-C-methyl-D-erythritol 4-phosphate cytidylyltransferase
VATARPVARTPAQNHDRYRLKNIFGLIPAAGTGTRMRADRPKQYLPLGAASLLERSLRCLLADARVTRALVVVAADDAAAAALTLPPRCTVLAAGGPTRAATVRNGVRALAAMAGPDDWVLVHDAARPCLPAAELAALIDAGGADEHGGLLAAPIADTVKREDDGGARVAATVDRRGLWRALTPQFFRIDVLARALERDDTPDFTDEAAAVEALGLHPRLVEGSASNIKVTTPGDLALAEAILRQQGRW